MQIPLKIHQAIGPLIILTLAVLMFGFHDVIYNDGVYQRDAILQGQWWRLVSGHFLHTNFNHLILNALGIILLWALHGEYYKPLPYLSLFTLMIIGTSAGMLVFTPSMQWYVGLSGALHGVFLWGAYQDILSGRRSGWLLLAGVIAKVGYEQFAGASASVAQMIAANVAIEAHLYGTISGLIWIGAAQQHKMRQR